MNTICNDGAHAGFVGNNPNTRDWDDKDAFATCMLLKNHFFLGQSELDATTAHEVNHSILEGYGVGLDSGLNAPADIFLEGGPSWMIYEVFDSSNYYYFSPWPTFEMPMENYTNDPYDYWITWRGLTERYGTGEAGGAERWR